VSGFDSAELGRLLATSATDAFAYVHAAARDGDAVAQTLLGQMYLDGQGCVANGGEALYWFQHAAHQQMPMAMNMLGRCYDNGWGMPADHGLAAVWFRRAADADLDWGVYNYAHLLATGRGVPADRAEAFRWFGRAAAMGHARAKHFLGQYFENGWETAVDHARARDLYRESAEGGDYRGECSWASVLTDEGRIDEAATFLRRGIAKAPAHYLVALYDVLRHSPHAALRELVPEHA
jgi:TPR repeat protein